MLNRQFAFWLMVIFGSLIARGAVAEEKSPMPCPLNFGQWELIPEFSDEFAGTKLDETKWFPYNPGWRGRQPGFFSKDNVEVKDGMLHLYAKA